MALIRIYSEFGWLFVVVVVCVAELLLLFAWFWSMGSMSSTTQQHARLSWVSFLVDSDLLAFVVVFCCGSILRWLMYSWWFHLVEIKSCSFRFSWLVGFDLASDWTILFGWGWSQLVGIIHYDDDVRHYSNLGLLFIGIFNLLVCNSEFDLSCCCFCVIMVWFVVTSSSPNSFQSLTWFGNTS